MIKVVSVRLLTLGFFAVSIYGCAHQAPLVSPKNEPIVQPNANLYIENIPPVPQSLADSVAKYSDFRGHSFVAWHPTRPEMIVSHRAGGSSTAQLFWVKTPMGKEIPITKHPERVGAATIEPQEGKYILFESSQGGSEQDQVFRQDRDGEAAIQLTDSKMRHDMGAWRRINGQPTGEILVSSVPLDRFMSPEERKSPKTLLRLIDPLMPEKARVIAQLQGTGWYPSGFSFDGQKLILVKYVSANDSEIWLMTIDDAKLEKLLPNDSQTKAVHFPVRMTRDGTQLFFGSDRQGEFRELMVYDIAQKEIRSFSANHKADLQQSNSDREQIVDSPILYLTFNVRGRSELKAFDTTTGREISLKGLPEGSISQLANRQRSSDIAIQTNNAQSPSDIYVWNRETQTSVQWTKAASPMNTAHFKPQEIITWRSFDGLEISGLINRPSSRFAGKRPVIIDIHGGPEAQSRIGFMGRWNYFLDELGVSIIQPNVRGSSGFGKTFLTLDNGYRREDSVKDIGALLDWVAQQPDLDPQRVLITGGSYGGYMSLAVSTHYPDRIAGAINIVGISHFVTFLETTETYRRDLRRVEYGDERDPKMREFLHSISPLSNAQKIKKPLFVVQGKNDPRVPYTEAEQIVAKARSNKSPVWYLRAENEGHGFARKENSDYYFYSMIQFMRSTILR